MKNTEHHTLAVGTGLLIVKIVAATCLRAPTATRFRKSVAASARKPADCAGATRTLALPQHSFAAANWRATHHAPTESLS